MAKIHDENQNSEPLNVLKWQILIVSVDSPILISRKIWWLRNVSISTLCMGIGKF